MAIPIKPKRTLPTTKEKNSASTPSPSNNPVLIAAQAVAQKLISSYGEGTVHYAGAALPSVKFSPSGSIVLDRLIGGGIPNGRIIEVYGKESSGKTTIAIRIAAQQVTAGKPVMYIDFEQAFDPQWAKLNGLDMESPYVFMAQPETAENGFDIIFECLKSKSFGAIVIDSVAAMATDKQINADIGADQVGIIARFLSQELRKVVSLAKESGTTLIFINQTRDKIQMGGMPMYGDTETTPGGRALKFYASVRMKVARTLSIKQGDAVIGAQTKIKIDKNKVGLPFRSGETAIMFDVGISILTEIIDAAVDLGLIVKRGAFYKMGEITLGQGKEAVRKYLRSHQELAYEFEQKIRSAWNLPALEHQPAYELLVQDTSGITVEPLGLPSVDADSLSTAQYHELSPAEISELGIGVDSDDELYDN